MKREVRLSSWMVAAPCLIVKPHRDWFLVTEPSVYTALYGTLEHEAKGKTTVPCVEHWNTRLRVRLQCPVWNIGTRG